MDGFAGAVAALIFILMVAATAAFRIAAADARTKRNTLKVSSAQPLTADFPTLAPFPHCDSLVLHAPGTCIYCDGFPGAQERRMATKVLFTGQEMTDKLAAEGWKHCPSETRRALGVIEQWPGNRPRPRGKEIDNFLGAGGGTDGEHGDH